MFFIPTKLSNTAKGLPIHVLEVFLHVLEVFLHVLEVFLHVLEVFLYVLEVFLHVLEVFLHVWKFSYTSWKFSYTTKGGLPLQDLMLCQMFSPLPAVDRCLQQADLTWQMNE